ncbi:MAG: type II toxin-antitoxin system VapC family toxin [Cellvibrionales bacterium]|nr:type II toxin-antitoxin system VapC family toxin [Cellvibrionales bacterium]
MDTCAIVWDAIKPSELTAKANQAIDAADEHNALIISDISIWEIAMLIQKGRLQIDVSAATLINTYLQTRNMSVIAISPEIADQSVKLDESINKDPADRIIAATAIIHNARLVTADENLLKAKSVDTLW